MTNATAAGPSYGIFDVLFGKVPKEEPAAEGEEFGPLLNLIKALNKEKSGDDAAEKGRTDKETVPGRGGDEYPYSVMPGMMMAPFANPMFSSNPTVAQETKDGAVEPGIISPGKSATVIPMAALQKEIELAKANAGVVSTKAGMVIPKEIPVYAAMSPETKAMLSGILLGGALAETRLAQQQNGSKLEGLVDPKELMADKQELKWTGSEIPVASTQDFMDLRTGQKIPVLENQLAAVQVANGQAQPELGKDTLATSGKQMVRKGTKGLEPAESIPGLAKGLDTELTNSKSIPVSAPAHGSQAELNLQKNPMHEMGHNLTASVAGGVVSKEVFLDTSSRDAMRAGLMPEVAQSVSSQGLKGGGEMKLIIRPDNLGEVHVKVGAKGGRIEVSVTAENKEVADIIRRGSKDLEDALGTHRLELSKFEVSVSDNGKGALAELKDAGTGSNLSSSGRDPSSSLFQEHADFNSQNRGGEFASSGRESNSGRKDFYEQGSAARESRPTPMPQRSQSMYSKSGRLDVVA